MTDVARRTLFTGGVAAVGGGTVGVLATRLLAETEPVPTAEGREEDALGRETVVFHGDHQAGITTAPQAFATLVAFDLLEGTDRAAVQRLMRIWTDDAARLTAGTPGLADTEPELAQVPARLTVTLGLGPEVFAAAGRENRCPAWLRPLPAFTVDRLEERWCGGDLLLQFCAEDQVTLAHAVRLFVKDARTFTTVRWVQRGFRNTPGTRPGGTTMRNLMGQVDGTRNLDPGLDPTLLWCPTTGPDDDWIEGGTSMVVRRIAMDLDTWDELDRSGRESAVGRRVDTGAPLTGTREHDEPDLGATGDLGFPVIDTFAHIRRARTEDTSQRFLRRAYNYDDPPPPGSLTDSGLVFITFQADPDHQFVPVQQRLDELDLLNEWTTPVGSAVFAVPRGCREGEYWGETLLS